MTRALVPARAANSEQPCPACRRVVVRHGYPVFGQVCRDCREQPSPYPDELQLADQKYGPWWRWSSDLDPHGPEHYFAPHRPKPLGDRV